MKRFFLFLLMAGWLSAAEYISIHQIDTKSGWRNFKDQITHSGDTLKLKTDYLPYKTSYRFDCLDGKCLDSKNPYEQKWCNTEWMRYKVYIPPHVERLKIFFYVRNNSSHAGLMYFVPDESPVKSVDFRNFKVLYEKYLNQGYDFASTQESASYLFGGYNPLFFSLYNIDGSYTWNNVKAYIQKGGWLYMAFAQADRIMKSEKGFVSDPKIKLYVTYEFDDSDKMDWLRYIKFTASGDPVENFSSLQEIQKACSGTEVSTIRGNNKGEYVFDPNIPSFVVSQIPHSTTIDYVVDFIAGEAPVEGVDPQLNSNITISTILNDCIELRKQPSSNHENGEFFYSDDSQHWTSEYNAKYKRVKYELSSPDSSTVVLNPSEKLSLDFLVRKTGECNKAQIHFKARYSVNSQSMQKERTLEYTFQVSSSSSSSKSSSSRQSSSSQVNDEASEREECERDGGLWLDHQCVISSGSSSSKSSSSDGENSSSSRINQQNISSTQQNLYEIVQMIENRVYPVKGYFVHYDSGMFDWLYRSSSGALYKLEGMDENGYFQWTPLSEYFDNVKIENDKLILGTPKITRDIEPHKMKTIERIAQRNVYKINGYFINYNEGAFDWIYVMGNQAYKLDGIDKNGYFKWIPLTNYFNTVEVVDYTRIKFGDAIISNRISSSSSIDEAQKACEEKNGEWDADRRFCIIYKECSSVSNDYQSSSNSTLSTEQEAAIPDVG